MVFLWPTLLWLLLAVPLLVALYAWLLHRRKQHVQTGLHGRRREESALPPHLISLGKTGEP